MDKDLMMKARCRFDRAMRSDRRRHGPVFSRSGPKRIATLLLAAAFMMGGCAAGLQPVDVPDETTPPPSTAQPWQQLEAVRSDDWFYLLNTGHVALDWRLRAIDSATDSIDLQTFIWDLDGSGELIRQHLLDAAARGVFVRVLVDDSFILDADQALLDIDGHDNIELKVFNPYQRRSSSAGLRQILNLGEFHRLDHRMHNKAMVIDNRLAVVGGRNLADHYFGYDENDNFRDLEVIVGGSTVQALAAGFDGYWNDPWSFPVATVMERRTGPGNPRQVDFEPLHGTAHAEQTPDARLHDWLELAREAHAGTATLLLDEPPDETPDYADEAPVQVGGKLIDAIDAARKEVWLVSAYLIPTAELEAALRRAIERGVHVRILTNSIRSNNHLTAHSAYRRHIRTLVEMGVEVHEVRDDAEDRNLYIESPVEDKTLCLHAKVLLLDDDHAFIGSANLDPRSLRINTEMGLMIDSPSLNAELRSALEPDFSLRNAWHVRLDDDGEMVWVSDSSILDHQPEPSYMRRIEDWFLSLLPLEDEL
jgi:putative cardiolipin synthase